VVLSSIVIATQETRTVTSTSAAQKTSQQIRIGQTFRVPGSGGSTNGNFLSYTELTRGLHSLGADIQKGMFFYREFHEPGQSFNRVPAFIFHSNPFKKGSGDTPWVDVIEPDFGYARRQGTASVLGQFEAQCVAKYV